MQALALRHFFGVLAAVELPAVMFSRRLVRALSAHALTHSVVKTAFEEVHSDFRGGGGVQSLSGTPGNNVVVWVQECLMHALKGCLIPRYRVDCQIDRLLSRVGDGEAVIVGIEVSMR